jgi:Domain of unknown function (DUF5004)
LQLILTLKKYNMKKIILILTISTGVFFSSCEKIDEKEIGAAQSKVDGLSGSWTISNVTQIDERNLPVRSRDISSFYTSTNNKITANFGSDKTFTMQNGDGINYLGTGAGTWNFDNDEFPAYLFLNYLGQNSLKIALGGPTRSSDTELKLLYTSSCDTDTSSVPRVSYKYVFTRN